MESRKVYFTPVWDFLVLSISFLFELVKNFRLTIKKLSDSSLVLPYFKLFDFFRSDHPAWLNSAFWWALLF